MYMYFKVYILFMKIRWSSFRLGFKICLSPWGGCSKSKISKDRLHFFHFFMTNLWARIQNLFISTGRVFKIRNLWGAFAFFLWPIFGLKLKICSSPWEGCSKSEISRRPFRSVIFFTIYWVNTFCFILMIE